MKLDDLNLHDGDLINLYREDNDLIMVCEEWVESIPLNDPERPNAFRQVMAQHKITLTDIEDLDCHITVFPEGGGIGMHKPIDLPTLLAHVRGSQESAGMPMGIASAKTYNGKYHVHFHDGAAFSVRHRGSRIEDLQPDPESA